MKSYHKQIIFGVYLLLVVTITACSKSSVTPNSNSNSSSNNSFTIRSNAYTVSQSADGTTKIGSSSSDNAYEFIFLGISKSNTKSEIAFYFNGTNKPSAGTYAVIQLNTSGSAVTIETNQVAILATDSLSVSKEGLFGSAGTDNINATLAFNSSGKATITLPVTMVNGNNIDNTDPSNSVATTLNTTLNGSFTEK